MNGILLYSIFKSLIQRKAPFNHTVFNGAQIIETNMKWIFLLLFLLFVLFNFHIFYLNNVLFVNELQKILNVYASILFSFFLALNMRKKSQFKITHTQGEPIMHIR